MQNSNILMYTTEDGITRMKESVWAKYAYTA